MARGLRTPVLDHLVAQVLDATVGAVGAAVIVSDAEGVVQLWNAGAEELYGWSAEEAVGVPARDLIVPVESRELSAQIRSAVLATGEWRGEFVCRRRDGSTVPVRVSNQAVADDTGEIAVIVCVTTDRTDELAAERGAKALHALAELSVDAVVTVMGETITSWNPAATRLLGWTSAEMVGRPVWTIIPEDHHAECAVVVDRVHRGESIEDYAAERVARDGTSIPVRLDVAPVLDPVSHEWFGVVTMRDQRSRDAQLDAAASALRASETRLTNVVTRSSDVAMFFDRDGTIEWVSPAMREVFGIDPEPLVGTHGFDLVHPDDLHGVLDALDRELRRSGDHVTLEFRVLGADGEVRWIEEVVTDLVDDPNVGYVVANLRDVTDRRLAHDQLARLALVDDLTGLPNRNALLDLTRTALAERRDGRHCGVVFFDIDDFCDVNDSLGHAVGDALLVGIADRLPTVLPSTCTLTRFGDDQFAIIAVDLDGPECCRAVARSVQAALELPFRIDEHEVFVAVSIGVALSPADDVDTLLRRADTALYRAKKSGRGQTVFFERDLAADSRRRLHYAGELRRGVERREIVPFYQPVVDLTTGMVVAVEALARWHHPVDGAIPPDVFIPAAEATGAIGELGRQVLERACHDARGWADRGRRLQVAVNASAVQLMDPGFPALVAGALADSGLDADQLTFEITETAAMREMGVVLETLVRLRDLGVDLSLDDFGTGYSSLSLLKRLPVEALKIDRSFVTGLGQSDNDDRIVTGVVSLGLVLGFRVVAEGVETREQAAVLRDLGCQFGQGYLWSPAVPAADLLATIAGIERWA